MKVKELIEKLKNLEYHDIYFDYKELRYSLNLNSVEEKLQKLQELKNLLNSIKKANIPVEIQLNNSNYFRIFVYDFFVKILIPKNFEKQPETLQAALNYIEIAIDILKSNLNFLNKKI